MQVPPLASEGSACCYICDLADTPGRFHPAKAAALGVPKGPMFGRLKAGQAVELPDGKTVQPAEVCCFVILFLEASCPALFALPQRTGRRTPKLSQWHKILGLLKILCHYDNFGVIWMRRPKGRPTSILQACQRLTRHHAHS